MPDDTIVSPPLREHNPTRQQIIDGIHELEALLAQQRTLGIAPAGVDEPVTDPSIRTLATWLSTAAHGSDALTLEEADRLDTTFADVLDAGGHEYSMWARIRWLELFREWQEKVRLGDVPPNWVWPQFPDAPLLEQIQPDYVTADWGRSGFEHEVTDLADCVTSGPSTTDKAGAEWVRQCRLRTTGLAESLRQPDRSGLTAGEAYRAHRVLAALFNLEQLLDTRGQSVAALTLITDDAAHEDWHTARVTRIVPHTTTAADVPMLTRWEWLSSVETLERVLHRAPQQQTSTRDQLWDRIARQIDHLQRTIVVLDAAEQRRAAVVLDNLRVVGARADEAWQLITDAELFQQWCFLERISDPPILSITAWSGLTGSSYGLDGYAAQLRIAHPNQPLPS
ncbi:hypothetical protein AB0C34_17895 [Nocardia sp. NPDC049220]|uniref:hypothetical protein n=1 Tax=Nocardia sp. NPDC049220 TaxID=3155273 RepID=UPI0033C3778A